jgi:hypothetical protein
MASKYLGVSPIDAEPGLARHFERFPEHLFGTLVPEVIDASFLRKRKVDGLWLFRLSDLFASSNETVIGFGLPNAYIDVPDGKGDYEKLSVKSLKRAPTSIDDTHGFAQAGVQLWLQGLPEEARVALRASMQKYVGQEFITCVLGCMTVLQDAGFTSGTEPLTNHKMPSSVLPTLIANGLSFRGQKVTVRVIRTTSVAATELFALKIRHAELATFRRHAQRNLEKSARTNFFARAALFVASLPNRAVNAFFDHKERQTAKQVIAAGLPYGKEYKKATLYVSMPSAFGRILRLFWGSHALYKVVPHGVNLDDYLTGSLEAFPQKNPGFVTRMKKKILFSPGVIKVIRKVLCPTFVLAGEKDERDFYDAISTHTKDQSRKFNLVVVGQGYDWSITVARISVGWGWVDWILSKHVLLTGWAKYVPFCGEFFKTEFGHYFVTPDSGTYMPDNERLKGMVRALQAVTPNVPVQGVPHPPKLVMSTTTD